MSEIEGRALSNTMQNFLSRPGYYVPYDSIQRIDSRAWDPNWRHRAQYSRLVKILTVILGSKSKAYSAASYDSFTWGVTGPVHILAAAAETTAETAENLVNYLFNREFFALRYHLQQLRRGFNAARRRIFAPPPK